MDIGQAAQLLRLVCGHQCRHLDRPAHFRQLLETLFQRQRLFGRITDAQRMPAGPGGVLDQRHFPLDRVEVLGLKMQHVVIVTDAENTQGEQHHDRGPHRQHPAWPGGETTQPGVGRLALERQDRLRRPGVQPAAVAEHQQRGQHGEAGEGAQQDAAAGYPAQLGHRLEIGQDGGEERQSQRRGRRQVADGHVLCRVQQGRPHRHALAARLVVAHHPQDPVVAHADQHDGKRGREDIQVADGQCGPTHRPHGADHERGHRQQGVVKTAVDHEEQHRDAGHGQPRGQGRIRLRRGHLIAFQHRHAGQADLQAGKFRLELREERTHGLHAFQRGSERALLLDRPDQQESQRLVAAEEELRLGQQVLLLRLACDQAAPRIAVAGRVLHHGRRGPADGQELGEKLLVAGAQRLPRLQVLDACLGLAQQAEQTQAVPRQRSQVEEQTHVHEVALDRLDLLQRQEQQGAVAQRAQIDLVKQAIEEVGMGPDALGDGLEGLFHPRPALAANHDHDIVIVAELIEILLPALLVVLFRADQVVALGVILQTGAGGINRQATEAKRNEQDEQRIAAHGRHQRKEQAAGKRRPGCEILFAMHKCRLPRDVP